jgi:hypothetical protein
MIAARGVWRFGQVAAHRHTRAIRNISSDSARRVDAAARTVSDDRSDVPIRVERLRSNSPCETVAIYTVR